MHSLLRLGHLPCYRYNIIVLIILGRALDSNYDDENCRISSVELNVRDSRHEWMECKSASWVGNDKHIETSRTLNIYSWPHGLSS